MATNITDLRFDEGAQINVVGKHEFTWITTAIELTGHGVWLEYHDDIADSNYRLFVPWHSVDRIYQEL